jgi:hypothetical protein
MYSLWQKKPKRTPESLDELKWMLKASAGPVIVPLRSTDNGGVPKLTTTGEGTEAGVSLFFTGVREVKPQAAKDGGCPGLVVEPAVTAAANVGDDTHV